MLGAFRWNPLQNAILYSIWVGVSTRMGPSFLGSSCVGSAYCMFWSLPSVAGLEKEKGSYYNEESNRKQYGKYNENKGLAGDT